MGDEWENMSDDDQADCLKYLQDDVLGLKEFSEQLNKSYSDLHARFISLTKG